MHLYSGLDDPARWVLPQVLAEQAQAQPDAPWFIGIGGESMSFGQATPGVPVGRLIAEGKFELGLQQLAELIGLEGVEVVSLVPQAIQIVTIFSAGVSPVSTQADTARALIEFMASRAATDAKRRHGMEVAEAGSGACPGVGVVATYASRPITLT